MTEWVYHYSHLQLVLQSTFHTFDDDNDSLVNTTDADAAASAFGVTMPLGNMTFAVGIADSDSGESSSGASVSAAVGGGTLKIGSQTKL